ncbi:MAG TPA: ATP-binding protein [Conexibacter sp.]|nr:ATP-binding protein [Conexibacter sp.]
MSLALGWSGGKDSALALRALRAAGREPIALITTVTEGVERISVHGVRRELLHAQARATGIPVVEVRIPLPCPNAVYEAQMEAALAAPPLDAVTEVAFGDLFLEDIRAYREERLAPSGRTALFPVWGRDTAALAREFLDAGFEAIVATVDPRHLDASFAGRAYDASFLADLPEGVDPCGENGEFHTFVHAGPIFETPIPVQTGEVVVRDGFVYADILPAKAPAAA